MDTSLYKAFLSACEIEMIIIVIIIIISVIIVS